MQLSTLNSTQEHFQIIKQSIQPISAETSPGGDKTAYIAVSYQCTTPPPTKDKVRNSLFGCSGGQIEYILSVV